jgi:hypothetical protein
VTALALALAWLTFHAHGVAVRYPHGWDATARPLTPVTAPAEVLAVGSFRLPRGPGGADGCEPKEALDRLPPGGAFVYAIEYGFGSRRDFPPRPRRFRLTGFARYECLGPSYTIRFRDEGRFFQVHVAFGRRAGAAVRATALRVLDSFRVERRRR